MSRKIAGHTNTLTPSVLEIIKINIFFRPGRSHVRNWQKLVLSLKILVLLKRIFDLHTKSYVLLDVNKIAGNTQLFKLTGELSLDNVTIRKNWIWDVLEIRWDDICMILNDKEIHLPTMLVIPLIHKLKVRKLFGKRDLLHTYIMLK